MSEFDNISFFEHSVIEMRQNLAYMDEDGNIQVVIQVTEHDVPNRLVVAPEASQLIDCIAGSVSVSPNEPVDFGTPPEGWMALTRRTDDQLRIHDIDLTETVQIDIIAGSEPSTFDPRGCLGINKEGVIVLSASSLVGFSYADDGVAPTKLFEIPISTGASANYCAQADAAGNFYLGFASHKANEATPGFRKISAITGSNIWTFKANPRVQNDNVSLHGVIAPGTNIAVAGIYEMSFGNAGSLYGVDLSAGTELWDVPLGVKFADIQALRDGTFAVLYGTGFAISVSPNIRVEGGTLVKYDVDGNVVWTQTDLRMTDGFCLTSDLDDNIYVGGESSGSPKLTKFDTDGNFVWNVTPGGSGGRIVTLGCDGVDFVISGRLARINKNLTTTGAGAGSFSLTDPSSNNFLSVDIHPGNNGVL